MGMNITTLIQRRRDRYGDQGVEVRADAENEARSILDQHAGQMDFDTFSQLGRLLNTSWYDGKLHFNRFSPAFHGATLTRLYGEGDQLNTWTQQIWKAASTEDALEALDQVVKEPGALPGAGRSYPSALMYLRDPDQFFVWTGNLDRGLQILADYEGSERSDGSDGYLSYCAAIRSLIAEHDLAPQEIDGLLTDAMRSERDTDVRPEDLAEELGVPGTQIREYLRQVYPRSEDQHGRAWRLTPQQVDAVHESFGEIADPEDAVIMANPWDEFIRWAKRYHSWEGFDEEERNYKLAVAEKIRIARDAVRADSEDWPRSLRKAFGPPNNLTFFIAHAKYLDWVAENADPARVALLALWDESASIADRLGAFLADLPEEVLSGAGTRLQVPTFLLMADAETYVIYRPTPFKAAMALVEYEEPPSGPEVAIYEHALGFLDELIRQANDRGLELRDRLDAQSVIWAVTKNDFSNAGLTGEELEGFLRYRGERPSVWWVNQGISLNTEMEAGVVSAPLQNKAGHDLQHWKNIELMRKGDVVLHYANTALRAISTVTHKPARGTRSWSEGTEGRFTKLKYFPLAEPIQIDDLPSKYRIPDAGPFTRQGAVKQVYLEPVSVGFSDWLREEYKDRWPEGSPWETKQRSTWLFQANPNVWDLAANLEEMELDAEDTWSVSRFKAELAIGDRVLLWQGGDEAGLYGIGQISGELFERGSEDEHFTSSENELAIPYRLTRKVDPPILRSTLLNHPVLKGLSVITAPQGTNFRVTDEQWTELRKLIDAEVVVPPNRDRSFDDIAVYVSNQGLLISDRTLRRFHISLATRGFVVLSGVSGTGKTWLTDVYAEAIGAAYLLVPVAPNWTTNEDLLGYLNPLDNIYYDTVFSQFLREAAEEYVAATTGQREAKKYILTLDEMNLARVEYYFAKFLSAMEVRSRRGTSQIELAPHESVQLTPNLLFIGTVNIDETTHGFADKVFDRAQLIELEAPREAIAEHIGQAAFRDTLLEFYDAVSEAKPFAFRVIDDIKTYVAESEGLDVEWQEAVDEQMLHKVLTKLTGADPAIRFALEQIVNLAEEKGFSLTLRKAQRMLNDYDRDGFTSFF
jgi:MoxR-like ATPase